MHKKLNKKKRRQPFVPGSDMSVGDILRDLHAAQRLKYGGITSGLAQRQRNVTNWFDQYKADIAAKDTAQQGVYANAVQQATDRADISRQAADAERARIDQQMQTDAAMRGATYSGTPGAQAAAGTDIRQGLADAFANLLRTQGTAYSAYTKDQGGVASAAQLSERLATDRAQQDLRREKGAFRTDYLAGRRQDELRNVLERKVFGLKALETQAKLQPKPKSRTERWGQRDTDKDGVPNAEDPRPLEPGTHAPDKSKGKDGTDAFGNTRAAQREAKRKYAKAQSLASSFAKKGDNPKEVYAFLQSKMDADPDILMAAAEFATRGYLGPKRFRRLKRLGVPNVKRGKVPAPKAEIHTPVVSRPHDSQQP